MDVAKHFGGLVAVKKISMKAKEGEIMGLIGPNGAGKPRKTPQRHFWKKRLAELIQLDIDSNIQKKLAEYVKNRKAE